MLSSRSGAAIAVLSWALAALACAEREEKTPVTIRVADGRQPVFGLLYLAEELGFTDDEGVVIETIPFTSGRDALDAVLAGRADVATVYETPIVLQTIAGRQVAVLTTLHHSMRNTGVAVRTDRGIRTAADLAGKRIAVTRRTNGEFCLRLMLEEAGVAPNDVTIVPTRPEEMAAAFAAGEVDAAATWQPNLDRALARLGPEHARVLYSDAYTESSVLAARREALPELDVALGRLVRALVRAERARIERPEAAARTVARVLDTTPEAVTAIWERARLTTRLDHALLTNLELEASWLSNGVAPPAMRAAALPRGGGAERGDRRDGRLSP